MTDSMLEPSHFVRNGDVRIAVYRWGEDHADRPTLLLVHGTGYCAPVWKCVAESLSSDFCVYAVDRRGHGLSSKPEDSYHFSDFAEDLLAVIEDLELKEAYGVGHSAGATDLLLAAARRPSAFRRLFVMEPTVMDPAEGGSRGGLSAERSEALAQTRRRRSSFRRFEDVLDRYRTRRVFLSWQPELLEIYVRHGFERCADASVELRCQPSMESAMLVHIYAVMEGFYRGDDRGNPFEALSTIDSELCCVSTAEYSDDRYKNMAQIAARLIPNARSIQFRGAGHAVAQEKPEEVSAAVRDFWHGDV